MSSRPTTDRLRARARPIPFHWPLFGDAARKADAINSLAAGDAAKAHDIVEDLLERAEDDPDVWWLLGRCYALDDDHGTEEDAYRKALTLDPFHANAEAGLRSVIAWRYRPIMAAWHLHGAERFVEALGAFHAAFAHIPERVAADRAGEIQAGIGWCQLALGNLAAAKAAFLASTAADPTLVHGWKGLGIALWKGGDPTAAEPPFTRAIELAPESADAHTFLGWCAYDRGDWSSAKARFEKALLVNPHESDPAWGKAWSDLRLGNFDSVRVAFREAIFRSPLHPSATDLVDLTVTDVRLVDVLPQLATALRQSGRPLLANRAATAWHLATGSMDALRERALTALDAGLHADALQLSIGHFPEIAARATVHLGRPADALTLLANNPSDSGSHALAEGEAYAALGQIGRAFESLVRAGRHSETAQIATSTLTELRANQRHRLADALELLAQRETQAVRALIPEFDRLEAPLKEQWRVIVDRLAAQEATVN